MTYIDEQKIVLVNFNVFIETRCKMLINLLILNNVLFIYCDKGTSLKKKNKMIRDFLWVHFLLLSNILTFINIL